MRASLRIYVGIKGFALALDSDTGAILWKTRLTGSQFVSIVIDGDRVFAVNQGEAYCLDACTGAVLWHNPLKGLGLGIAFLVAGKRSSIGAAEAQTVMNQENSPLNAL
jgi:outer membrane protein assembly factor BamB